MKSNDYASDVDIIEEFIEEENGSESNDETDINNYSAIEANADSDKEDDTIFDGSGRMSEIVDGSITHMQEDVPVCATIDKSAKVPPASYEIAISPGGKKYWIPHAPPHLKLAIGDEFTSIDEADRSYRRYADEVGFDVRQATRKKNKYGNVQTRYLFCSREGEPVKRNFDSLGSCSSGHKLRKSNVKRTGCKACVKFRYRKGDGKYVIYKLEETHNHRLYDSNDKRFARSRRQLKYTDYRNIYNAAGASIGGSRCHSIQSALKGGIECIGATPSDYDNARRDMIAYVGIKDAQMLINLFTRRKATNPDFFFEYMCEKGELQCMFWADEICKLNYTEFGDTISFDATYRTNRHAMNFVPFIAIDNHKRSVVVGAALISHEKAKNYEWVLNAFLHAHSKQPKFVITDQCPSMKQAIPKVFTDSNHRLCAWHIMKSLPNKVSSDNNANVTYKRRINRLVWSPHVTVEEFETEWMKIVNDYDLHGNEWFVDKYEIRESWICANIKDEPMSGLMRTTSRSESSHAYFRLFASFKNDFVRFVRAFDGAIDKQRNKHSCLEFANRHTFPRCATPLPIEQHASEMFTRVVFFDIQKEIRKAVYFCGLELQKQEEYVKIYIISHKTKKMTIKQSYEVVQNESEDTYVCTCNMFTRIGIICRHILKVLINDGVHTIPASFIIRRWTRALIPVQIQAARARYGEIDVEKEQLINGMYKNMDLIISRVRDDKVQLKDASDSLVELTNKYGADTFLSNRATDRAEALKECYGVDAPENPGVLPAAGICNKGCGKGKRLKGAMEKAVEKSKRPKRKCKICDQFAHHDSRNCPARDA